MKKQFYFTSLFVGLIAVSNCKKPNVEIKFDDVTDKPYTTGIIKLQYQVYTIDNGIAALKDTIVNFTSRGNNAAEYDDYGYSKPSIPWAQMMRLNPTKFENRALIFVAGTNLNSLALPYKFQTTDLQYAQINYTIGYKPYYDPGGNLIHGTDTYTASTQSNDFELTITSRINNRLQGTFSGTVRNQNGLTIDIKKGLFDIQIVEK